MGITIDGNDITFSGTVKVVNGFNPDTGVAYLILTPDGGYGVLPFFDDGAPGLPPVFDSMSLVEVEPTDELPTPNPVVTVVSEGGPGVASHYTLTFYLHKGATGDIGTNEISTASDLDPSVPLGVSTNGFTLSYNSGTGLWVPVSPKVGDVYVPASIAATSFTNAGSRTLATVNVPAQPWNWRPTAYASTVITGSSDTRVDLAVRINNATSGDQVGYCKGVAGSAPPPMTLIPCAPDSSSIPGSYGRVAGGSAATIYLRAEQKASSSNSWSTPSSADMSTTFWVKVDPTP